MPEWDFLDTSLDSDAGLINIPLYPLKTLPTEDLFITFLQFYQIGHLVIIHDSFYHTYEILDKHCNIFHELIRRSDIVTVLEKLKEEGCPYPTDYESEKIFEDRENYLKMSFSDWDQYIAYIAWGVNLRIYGEEGFPDPMRPVPITTSS